MRISFFFFSRLLCCVHRAGPTSSGLLPLTSNISNTKQPRPSSQPDPDVFPGRCRHNRCLSDDAVLTRRRHHHSSFLVTGFASFGLDIALDKTEVIPACSASQTFFPSDFPGCTWIATRNFKLLGAAVGDRQWCESLLSKRAAKASALIRAIGRYRVPHGAFKMLRSCAGWARILNSCRTVPPSLQSGALARADFETRSALGRLVSSPLSGDDWRHASLRISSGRIGGRSAQEDAPAAYIASLSATAKLSRRIWPAFDEYDLDSGCLWSDAESQVRSCFPDGADFADEFVSSSQKAVPSMIEARAFSEFMASSQVEVHRKAHLVLNLNPAAGAWLTSIPNSSDTFLQAYGAVSQ